MLGATSRLSHICVVKTLFRGYAPHISSVLTRVQRSAGAALFGRHSRPTSSRTLATIVTAIYPLRERNQPGHASRFCLSVGVLGRLWWTGIPQTRGLVSRRRCALLQGRLVCRLGRSGPSCEPTDGETSGLALYPRKKCEEIFLYITLPSAALGLLRPKVQGWCA